MTLDKQHLAATVRVYSKPNCVQCTMTKRLLDDLGVPYAVEDITKPEVLAALKEDGFLAAPVVKVGDGPEDIWSGFQPPKIKALAERLNNTKEK